MTEKPFYTTLENRGLITISGPDRHSFLQGLITNNIDLLKTQPMIYGCLLTAQGKFLHDFFLFEDSNIITIDCEGGPRALDLARRLTMYKLRADVTLDVAEQNAVYAILGTSEFGYPDPRHPEMGHRSFEKPELPEAPFEIWDQHRLRLTIPDGSRDLIPEKSTMDEARMDQIHAIDYEKGCYIGQELTARMHYRGLGKKHLYTVEGDLPEHGEAITADGKTIGEMRSKSGLIGLALLKDNGLDSPHGLKIS